MHTQRLLWKSRCGAPDRLVLTFFLAQLGSTILTRMRFKPEDWAYRGDALRWVGRFTTCGASVGRPVRAQANHLRWCRHVARSYAWDPILNLT